MKTNPNNSIVAESKSIQNSACSDESVIYQQFRQRFKENRLKKNLTFEELERLTGIKKSNLQRYESGNTEKVPFDVVLKLEQALGADGCLTGWKTKTEDPFPDGASELVRFQLSVARRASSFKDSYPPEKKILYSDRDYTNAADFCIYMPDTSMSDIHLNIGDVIFVKKQDYLNDGDLGVFSYRDELFVRYYYYNVRGCTLCSTHRMFPPISIPSLEEAGYTIIGKAVAFQSSIG